MTYCCATMEKQAEERPGRPFTWLSRYSVWGTNPLRNLLAIRVFDLTPSGRLSQAQNTPALIINYCPFCGKDLRAGPKEEEEP